MSSACSAIKMGVELKLRSFRLRLDELVAEGRAEEAAMMAYGALFETLVSQSKAAYGKRSEQVDPEQIALLLEHKHEEDEDEQDEAVSAEESDGSDAPAEEPEAKPKPRRHRHGRGKLPEGLPHETVVHVVPEAERQCPTCNAERLVVGHETSEVLEFVPAHFKVIVHDREKRACPDCRETGMVVADAADKPFDRCMAGPGLLAQVVVSKFSDFQPLTRISRGFSRLGVDISVSTLSGWLTRLAPVLQPIADLMWEQVLASFVIQNDASGLRVLDRTHEDNVVLGTMWCYVGDYTDVVFRYAPDGTGAKGPWTALAGRTGYFQSDGANVFMRLHNGKAASVQPLGCWFHARRPFFSKLGEEPDAAVAVDFIQQLYRIEAKAETLGLDADGIRDLRQAEALPILSRFRRWIDKRRSKHSPRSALGAGLSYCVKHWAALIRYTEDGRLRPDNNICEGQIRDLALGRKNFLFAGSHAGAHNVALYYSLMRTCARNGVNPYAWLTDVITKLAAGWPNSRLAELLPARWAEQSRQQPESNPV